MSHLINLYFGPGSQRVGWPFRRGDEGGHWPGAPGMPAWVSVSLLYVLFAIPAAVTGDSSPQHSRSPIQSNWMAETAVNTRFKKCFL